MKGEEICVRVIFSVFTEGGRGMKRILLVVIAVAFFLSFESVYATTLVGLRYNQDKTSYELHTIDVASGLSTFLGDMPNYGNSNFDRFELNHDKRRAGYWQDKILYEYDLTNGNLVTTTDLDIYKYNTYEYASPTSVVSMSYNTDTQENELYLIEIGTGRTTLLRSFSFDSGSWNTGSFMTLPEMQRAFALSGANTLYEFDLTNGNILSTRAVSLPPGTGRYELLSRNSIAALAYNDATGKNELYTTDIDTGRSTLLKSFTFDTGYYSADTFTVNRATKRAYVMSSIGTLYEFDLTNGNILSTRRLDGPYSGARVLMEEGPSLARIVAGSITYRTIEDNTGLGITFDPKSNFGLTLANVATLGGFSHFNWMQIVNKWPGASALISDGFCVPRIPLALPYLDPPPRGIGNMIWCSPADELQFYYDEVTEVDGKPLDPDFYISKQIDQNSFVSRLNFYDIPSNAFVIPGINYMEFWTYLVGVTSDNKARILWGPLKWKSDHNIWGFGGALRNHEPLPPGGEGGIFEVEEMASLYDAPLDVMEVLRDAGSEWPVTDETEAVIVKGSINDDPERDCVSFGSASIVLDGTWSMDPEGDPLTYTWTGPFGSVEGERVTVTVPVGTHEITLTVDDGKGGVDSDTVEIMVEACPLNCDINGNGKFDGRDVAEFVKGCGKATIESYWCKRNSKWQGKKWYDTRCPAEGVPWLCDVNGDGQFNGRDVAAYQKQCKVR